MKEKRWRETGEKGSEINCRATRVLKAATAEQRHKRELESREAVARKRARRDKREGVNAERGHTQGERTFGA
eukprot:2789096-Pleurochrysis_carterae.AAC.2